MSTSALTNIDSSIDDAKEQILSAYANALSGVRPDHYVKQRPDGPYLVIEFAAPSEHHYGVHNSIAAELAEENPLKGRSTVQRRKKAAANRLALPETQMLKKVIAESLTIDKNSFNEDFFSRYTASVTGLEQQVTTRANFVVYGRRGSGKSSLLAYAMHTARQSKNLYCWIAMQTFAKRADLEVVPAVLAGILDELKQSLISTIELDELMVAFETLSEATDKAVLGKCDRLIPRLRRVIGKLVNASSPLTIFLDDIHVLDETVQPLVLSYIYKITRGNNIYIKASGIAQLTKLWDSAQQIGLQAPHDTQILNLDLNLTMPDKSKTHIESILDAHAGYCGLPNIRYLIGEDAFSRLVLCAAGVPRDSLSLFSIAISKAVAKSQKLVSITSINAAASEMVEEKIKDIERDSGSDLQSIQSTLADVKKFCVLTHRKNSFLVEMRNSNATYKLIQKLIALRLVHLLHEGITPHEAGKRFIALMLDYGFYVGIRAARSVDFIPSEPKQLSAKELRSLPIFH